MYSFGGQEKNFIFEKTNSNKEKVLLEEVYSRGKTLNIVSRKATNTKIFPVHFHCPITTFIDIKDIKRLKGQIKLWSGGAGGTFLASTNDILTFSEAVIGLPVP